MKGMAIGAVGVVLGIIAYEKCQSIEAVQKAPGFVPYAIGGVAGVAAIGLLHKFLG